MAEQHTGVERPYASECQVVPSGPRRSTRLLGSGCIATLSTPLIRLADLAVTACTGRTAPSRRAGNVNPRCVPWLALPAGAACIGVT